MTGLPLSVNKKSANYDSILVIVNRLIKIVLYKPVKVTIDTPRLAKKIINMVMRYHSLSDSIISDRRAIFMSKFWFLLCYFFNIKRQLSIAFHIQTDDQTKRQNSIIKVYLCLFGNFEQKN